MVNTYPPNSYSRFGALPKGQFLGNSRRFRGFLRCSVAICLPLIGLFFTHSFAHGQMGGMGGMGGGMPGGGAPAALAKQKFADRIHEDNGLTFGQEKGEKLVLGVRVVGNTSISTNAILQRIHTRKDRFFDDQTLLSDVHTLHEMGAFDNVTFETTESAEGVTPAGVYVTFKVHERPVITKVIFFGNTRLNNRELDGRAGLKPGDPLNPYAIESAKRRLIDYYHEEGFNRVAITTEVGGSSNGSTLPQRGPVVFRINEGEKERVWDIKIIGSTIVDESRLKKIIKSRDSGMLGLTSYFGNEVDFQKIDRDMQMLQAYFHSLGFLTATVGRSVEYGKSGKWMTITFVVEEGPRFTIGDIQIQGNQYITEESLRARQELKVGDYFDGKQMQADIGTIIYGYGELGFIYAEVIPKTVIRDEGGVVDLVYEIHEGDRWRVNEIHVNIDGEPHLMKEKTIPQFNGAS